MRTNLKTLAFGIFTASLLAFSGCKKPEDRGTDMPTSSRAAPLLQVEKLELGSAVDGDKKVVDKKETFKPNETIYVSVQTRGTAPDGATMTARWKYNDTQVVTESSQKIVPSGATATEFHIQKPDGWPEGKYQVDILMNGQKVASEDFEVKAAG
jgi:hypothetical protein